MSTPLTAAFRTSRQSKHQRAHCVKIQVEILLQHLRGQKYYAAVGVGDYLVHLLDIVRRCVIQPYVYRGQTVFLGGFLDTLYDRRMKRTVVNYAAVSPELDKLDALEALGAGKIPQLACNLKKRSAVSLLTPRFIFNALDTVAGENPVISLILFTLGLLLVFINSPKSL